jgi:enoyl-CoA hydratase
MHELHLTIHDQIATVTITRPEQHNAVTYAMWQALPELCRRIDADDNVRVIIWRGAGRKRSARAVTSPSFVSTAATAARAVAYNACVQAALDAMLALHKPSIALVKGYCVGGGFILAAHCDLRIAADNAHFGLPVARLGFLITYPQMQRFVQMFGAAVVGDLLLTARLLDAPQALAAGLCSQVHPLATIDETVLRLAQTMTRLSPLTQRRHKAMLQTVLHKPDLSQLTAAELAVVDEMFDSADYAEGVRAFIEKRSPRF